MVIVEEKSRQKSVAGVNQGAEPMIPPVKDRVMGMNSDMTNDELLILLEVLEGRDRFIEEIQFGSIPHGVTVEYQTPVIKGEATLQKMSLDEILLTVDTSKYPLFNGQSIILKIPYQNRGKRVIIKGEIVKAPSKGVGIEFTDPPKSWQK